MHKYPICSRCPPEHTECEECEKRGCCPYRRPTRKERKEQRIAIWISVAISIVCNILLRWLTG